MIFAYGASYGLAAGLGRPRQVEAVRNIDRVLFLGTDPNVWIQQHFYDAAHVRCYDVAASIVYFTHFVVPATVIVVLSLVDRSQWVRFMKRCATVLFIAWPPRWVSASARTSSKVSMSRAIGSRWTLRPGSCIRSSWSAPVWSVLISMPLKTPGSLRASSIDQ